MKRSELNNVPAYFTQYTDKVDDIDLLHGLDSGGIELYLEQMDKLKEIGLKVYKENKWTINQIIEHLIDTERIFINRCLRFLRLDSTDLPGYDENNYANTARSNDKSIDKLLEDYQLVRLATVSFFSQLNEDELKLTGKANGVEISIAAMGFILIGHPIHHFKVIEERYFGLV